MKPAVAKLWAEWVTAVAFLTRLPVPPGWVDGAALGRSAAWYPAVGALIGALAALADWVAGGVFPAPAQALAPILAHVLLTGGLHLDGLMDTADGVMAGGDRERALTAMRDSRVGAMGALAGALALLVRYGLLLSLAGPPRGAALVVAAVAARWGIVWAGARYAAARQGLGSAWAAGLGTREMALATVSALLLVAGAGALWGSPARAAFGLLAGAVTAALVARWLNRRLGGLTGDTYGAVAELAELAVLAAAACRCPAGWTA